MANPTSSAPQIKRVGRYYRKFKAINEGVLHDRPSDELEDKVYGFFQNCHHLKDWLKEDPALASLGNVEHFINQCSELRICADLCNATKHFRLTKPPRSDVSPRTGAKRVELAIAVGAPAPPTIRINYEIDTIAGTRDAFEIATICMNTWAKYLGMEVKDF